MFGLFKNAVIEGVSVQRDKNLIPDKVWKKIRKGRYEKGEREAALKVALPGDIILELGSGIGLTAAILSKNSQVEKIIAFEANPELFPFARAMLKENEIENVELRNAILSNSAVSELDFYIREPFWSSSLSPEPDNFIKKNTVPVQNANQCIAEVKPDIIISDIEGGEIDFFDEALDLSGVRAIVVEVHPKKTGVDSVDLMKKILFQKGFTHTLETSKPNVIALLREALN